MQTNSRTVHFANPGRRGVGLAIALLLGAVPVSAAIHTVGSDVVACDFTNLASAISSAASGDVLRLQAMEFLGVSGSNFNIPAKSLTLRGGYASCNAATSTSTSRLVGGGADTVLEIFGSGDHSVTLEHIELVGGEDDADDGGGLEISGAHAVTLLDVNIFGNDSQRGAGIHIDGSGGATLLIGNNSRIHDNEATVAGGGLYCENDAQVQLLAPVTVRDNSSLGDGGGLWVGSSCNVDLFGSQTIGVSVYIGSNSAQGDGGGLFITDTGAVYGQGESTQTVVIDQNEAGMGASNGFGGGAYASGFNTRFDLDRGVINANRADQGGGLYATDAVEVSFYATGGCANPNNDLCSVIGRNNAPLAAAIVAVDGAFVDVELTLISRNGPLGGVNGEAPIAFVASGGEITLEGCVLQENKISSGTALAGVVDTGGFVRAAGTTFTGNTGLDHLFWVGGDFVGRANIFDEEIVELFNVQSSGNWFLDCAVVTPGLSLPAGGTNVVFADPLLVDPVGLDFHVAEGSPAIDLCGESQPGLSVDLDLQPRPMGLGYDAGADEFAPPLFVDGFESGDVSAWSSATP